MVATSACYCEVDPEVQDCTADTSLDDLHFLVQHLAGLAEGKAVQAVQAVQAVDGEANYLQTFLLETSAAVAGIDRDSVVEKLQGCGKG